jgi:hypothetical protein
MGAGRWSNQVSTLSRRPWFGYKIEIEKKKEKKKKRNPKR